MLFSKVTSLCVLGALKSTTTVSWALNPFIQRFFVQIAHNYSGILHPIVSLSPKFVSIGRITLLPTATMVDVSHSANDPKKPIVVFVLGGPGSGKGTQCAKIVQEFHFVHLSAGELLREEMKSGSKHGTMIAEIMKEGKIVPSEITVGLLKNAMEKSPTKKFLIDGFPRNMENNNTFERELGTKVSVPFLLLFECPEEVMLERLMNRGQTSGRLDDNVATIKKRFQNFVQETLPVIEYYDKKNKVRRIDANRPIEVVYQDVQKLFKELKE